LLTASTEFSSINSILATGIPICMTVVHVSTAALIEGNVQIMVFSASGMPNRRSSACTHQNNACQTRLPVILAVQVLVHLRDHRQGALRSDQQTRQVVSGRRLACPTPDSTAYVIWCLGNSDRAPTKPYFEPVLMIRPSGITAVSAITAVFMLPYLNKEQTLNAWLTSKLIDTYDSLPHSGGARCVGRDHPADRRVGAGVDGEE